MLGQLEALDYELFKWINRIEFGAIDAFMIILSDKLVWIPLYLLIIYGISMRYGRRLAVPILLLILIVTLSDQITSSLMKPYFERLRPCHDPLLQETIRIIDGCGGKFGFASSHAANTMGLAIGSTLLLGSQWSWLIIWALLVGASRIFLGVHFPGDVLIGALSGSIIAVALLSIARPWIKKR